MKAPTWLPESARRAARLIRYSEARADAWYELRRRTGGEPALPSGPMRRLLVICHGNICRSPVAEVLLANRLPALEVRSAGIAADDGGKANEAAGRAAGRLGLSLADHRTRHLREDDLDWADLVLGMEGRHTAAVAQRWPGSRAKLRLLGDFLPAPPHRLQDPWGEPDTVFDEVFGRLANAVEQLARRIEVSASP